MDKYKIKSTIYGVFLIVTLIVCGLLFFLLINNDNKIESDDKFTREEVLNIANDIYNKTYIYANNNMFTIVDDAFDLPQNTCTYYKLDEQIINDYFSETAINNIKNKLQFINNEYYDCYNLDTSILDNTILKIYNNNFDIVSYTDDYIVIRVNDNSLKTIIFTIQKVNDKWLIDNYE